VLEVSQSRGSGGPQQETLSSKRHECPRGSFSKKSRTRRFTRSGFQSPPASTTVRGRPEPVPLTSQRSACAAFSLASWLPPESHRAFGSSCCRYQNALTAPAGSRISMRSKSWASRAKSRDRFAWSVSASICFSGRAAELVPVASPADPRPRCRARTTQSPGTAAPKVS